MNFPPRPVIQRRNIRDRTRDPMRIENIINPISRPPVYVEPQNIYALRRINELMDINTINIANAGVLPRIRPIRNIPRFPLEVATLPPLLIALAEAEADPEEDDDFVPDDQEEGQQELDQDLDLDDDNDENTPP